MFISKKEYKRLKQEEDANRISNNLLNRIDSENRIIKSRLSLLEVIEKAKNFEHDEDSLKKLELLRDLTINDLCASNYITQDFHGNLVIDVNQIPWTFEELISRLETIISNLKGKSS